MRTTIALIAVSSFLLSACSSTVPKTASTGLSMNASSWTFKYGVSTPKHPTQDGSGWKYTHSCDKMEVDYITCSQTRSITASAIELTVAVECAENVWFDHVTESGNIPGGNPSACRLMVQRDLTTEFGRWFSCFDFVELKPGQLQTIRVPLTPDRWSSVYGKRGDYSDAARMGFYAALSRPQALALVFGGGNFYGHGLRARNGNAIVKILSYRLVP